MIAEEEEEVALEEAQAERVELRLNQIAQAFELKAREAEALLSWARQGLASTGAAINSLDSIRAQGSSTISQVALLNQMLFRLNIEPVIPTAVRPKRRSGHAGSSHSNREDDAAHRLARSTAASVTDELLGQASSGMSSLSLNGMSPLGSSTNVESYSRISVHNLPYSATKQQVMSIFAPFGRLAGLRLKHGYAFVEFESSESAAAAMNTKHPLMLDNRQLRLELETKRFPREGDDNLIDEDGLLRDHPNHGNRLLVRVKPRMQPKDSLEEALRPISNHLVEVSAPRDGGASFLVSYASPEALQDACTALHDQTVRIRTRSYQLACTIDSIDPLWHMPEEEMRKLKRWAFRGRTEIVTSAAQVAPAIQLLLDGRPLAALKPNEPLFLGLDAEWRPVFTKGTSHPIAMLQLASRNTVVLFRLHHLEDEFYHLNPQAQEFALPKPLEQVLTSPLVRKVGVGLRDDAAKINAEFGIKCEGIIDIADLPQTKRCKPQSLQGLTAMFLGFYHDKSASKTNWEAEQLSQRQILYAATDAWVSRELYFVMKDLAMTKAM